MTKTPSKRKVNLPRTPRGKNKVPQANKADLIDAVAKELNVPRRTATIAIDAVLDSVEDLLRNRGKVAVKGFGTFERKIRKGRRYRIPNTDDFVVKSDKEVVMFKTSDQLVDRTKTNSPPRKSELRSLLKGSDMEVAPFCIDPFEKNKKTGS